ncbi:MAG: hypothetical protein JXB00_13030 [Bacteroidales bacterium]|nr:hypothetical protein [Bacteroidales bacterium]
MNSIPNIPTDSLYKFLSISGLVIILLSVSSYIISFNKLKSEKIEFEKKAKLLDTRINYSIKDLRELILILRKDFPNKLDVNFINKFDSIYKIDSINNNAFSILGIKYKLESIPSSDSNPAIIETLLIELADNIKALDSNRIELNYNNKQLLFKRKLLRGHLILGISGLLIGISLSLIGFYNWYFKHQIYQDRLIKKT